MEVIADVSKHICIHMFGMHPKKEDIGLDGFCRFRQWCKYI